MIGVIADDVTGATDVCAALSNAGLRTLLALTPDLDAGIERADAVVIGLKTRSLPPEDAVAQSLAALDSLRRLGADRLYLKYCSTFDSTARGNIGPVTEHLAVELEATTVVTTPAAPRHGRTVYQGHLFVGDALLHETHMRTHPITPMLDSSVLRLLARQTRGRVELLPLEAVREGVTTIRATVDAASAAGISHLVADAIAEEDLTAIADAVQDHALVAGSAGLIGAIARLRPHSAPMPPAPPASPTAIIAGSCSRRTLEQIARYREAGGAAHSVKAGPDDDALTLADRAVDWWERLPVGASALMFSSAEPEALSRSVPGAAALYEDAAGLIAVRLAERGVRRMLIAGGETSGAVIQALGTRAAVVGEEAAVGVPWIHIPDRDLHLILKSGNFGEPELFVELTGEGALT